MAPAGWLSRVVQSRRLQDAVKAAWRICRARTDPDLRAKRTSEKRPKRMKWGGQQAASWVARRDAGRHTGQRRSAYGWARHRASVTGGST